ncbi:MAG: polymer-forming cytoskeletal protein, partial [Pseudomonadota bacterium]
RIDGAVQGNIECQGLLVVGNEGKIEGDIVADSAIVGGEVIGNISAKNRLEIISKGKVVGDIITSHLVIADGVIFQGFCRMLDRGANVNPVLDQEEMPKEVEQ